MGSLSITLTRTLSSDGPFIGGPLVAAGDKTSIALTDEGLFAHHRVGHSNTGAGNDLRIRVLNANRHHRVGHKAGALWLVSREVGLTRFGGHPRSSKKSVERYPHEQVEQEAATAYPCAPVQGRGGPART